MSSFTTPLEVEFKNGHSWRVTHPFTYHLGAESSPDFIEVPVGFVTDFASVPRGLWNVLPPTGPYGKAAVIHDWLYQGGAMTFTYTLTSDITGETREERAYYYPKGRKDADDILLEAMGVLGVNWFTKQTVYGGVRAFGQLAWKNGHRRKVALNGINNSGSDHALPAGR